MLNELFIEKVNHSFESYIKVLLAMILARKQSQLKGMSLDQKILSSQQLIKVIEYQDSFNFVQTLFGYTLGAINTALNDKFIFDLKKKYSMIQQLFFNKALDKEGITLIVIDGIQTYRKAQGIPQKQERMLVALGENIEQTMMNHAYIHEKWKRQAVVEEENKRNELAFKKFLEQETLQMKKQAEEMQAQGWECQVCLTEIDRNNFGILQCSHIFHPQCISAYLKTKIQASELDIKCPMQGCGLPVQVGDIYQYADPDLKQKFQKFSFNKFMEQNNSSTAWCPTAGCSAAFQFDQALDNYKCPACHNHYCLKCKCIYHNGMTCAQYRINNSFDKNDEDFIKFVRGAKFKQCPRCKYWVQRSQGCSTMACKCGQEFCYNCGGTTCPHGMCANLPQVPEHRPVPIPVHRPRPIPMYEPRRPMPAPVRPVKPNKKR